METLGAAMHQNFADRRPTKWASNGTSPTGHKELTVAKIDKRKLSPR